MNIRRGGLTLPRMDTIPASAQRPLRAPCEPQTLIRLLKAGEIEALDQLTRCYGDQLLRAARRYCRTEQEARDAVQDAALNAWRYGPGLRGSSEGPLAGWLTRLVASACARMRRGMRNDPALHVADEELSAVDQSPEELSARSELAGTLAAVLAELSPLDRSIVILADAEGWKGPAIAAELGLSHAAVRARLSRAHKALRAKLSP